MKTPKTPQKTPPKTPERRRVSKRVLPDLDVAITGTEIAELISTSLPNVIVLAREGVFAKAGEKYELKKTINSYVAYLRKARSTGSASAQRSTLVAEQTRKLRFENDTKEGLLCEMSAVVDLTKIFVGTVQSELANLPRRTSRDNKIVALIENEVSASLERIKLAVTQGMNDIFTDNSEEAAAATDKEEVDEE